MHQLVIVKVNIRVF